MIFKDVDTYLRLDSVNETWHKEHPNQKSRRYDHLRIVGKEQNQDVYDFDFCEEMRIEDVCIFKETRYTPLLPHKHRYLEINYVYDGSCEFLINNIPVTLKKGEICIIEPDVIHSAKMKGEKDIIMNMVLNEKVYSDMWLLSKMKNKKFSAYLLECIDHTIERNKFIVFRNDEKSYQLVEAIMSNILFLYFSNRNMGYYSLMKEYILILFMQLSNATLDTSLSTLEHNKDQIMLTILKYIDDHLTNCSLKEISNEFGYNYSYISNLIKEKTHSTFSQLKLQKQLAMSRELLLHTQMTVYEICEQCGICNQSYFYKKFKIEFGRTPQQLRLNEENYEAM